jgi:integrase
MPRNSSFGPGIKADRGALVVTFQWQGQKCRERFPKLDPQNPKHVAEAQQIKADIEAAKRRGVFDYDKFFPHARRTRAAIPADPTLAELIALFEPVRLRSPRIRTQATRENIQTNHQRIMRYAPRAVLATPTSQLRPSHIRVIGEALLEAGLAPSTAANTLQSFASLFDLASAEHKLGTNPAKQPGACASTHALNIAHAALHGRDLDAMDARDNAPSDEVGADPFTETELTALITTAEASMQWFAPIVQFAAYTGIRPGELFALTWKDLDEKTASVQIVKIVARNGQIVHRTKTPASRRRVYLCPPALDALKAQAHITEAGDGDALIFCSRFGGRFRYTCQLNRHFATLCQRAGVDKRPAYQLRHTYATQMLLGGERIEFVAKQLGHKNAHVTHTHYARFTDRLAAELGRPLFRSAFAAGGEPAAASSKVVPIRRRK